eukprot:1877775-Rhodomonas_salina.1
MQLWFKILLKYEGVSETIDSNFVAEYNDLTAMGMSKAGKKHIHIKEVDHRLVLQLEAAQKAFTTVKDLCEHLRICALTSIVKDLAKSEIAEANAWRMADNHLVAYKATISASAMQMTICTVTTAISIAQKHIEQMPEEIVTPAAATALRTGAIKLVLKVGSKRARTEENEEEATAEDLAAEIRTEQSALAEKQRALALITTGTAAQ